MLKLSSKYTNKISEEGNTSLNKNEREPQKK